MSELVNSDACPRPTTHRQRADGREEGYLEDLPQFAGVLDTGGAQHLAVLGVRLRDVDEVAVGARAVMPVRPAVDVAELSRVIGVREPAEIERPHLAAAVGRVRRRRHVVLAEV